MGGSDQGGSTWYGEKQIYVEGSENITYGCLIYEVGGREREQSMIPVF